VFADYDATWIEGRLEHAERLARLGIAAHENIERRIALFRPSVDADVAFGQDGNAGDAAAFRERVRRMCRSVAPVAFTASINAVSIRSRSARPSAPIVDDQMTSAQVRPLGNKAVFVVVADRRTTTDERPAGTTRGVPFLAPQMLEFSHFGHLPC
jgi:hypothetical protein